MKPKSTLDDVSLPSLLQNMWSLNAPFCHCRSDIFMEEQMEQEVDFDLKPCVQQQN
jgi:hypothetical protein